MSSIYTALHGWQLVPVIPTERMLSEFSGVWWPNIPRDKGVHEEAAYAAMLSVAPSPPVQGESEVEGLRELNKRLSLHLKTATESAKKARSERGETLRQLNVANDQIASLKRKLAKAEQVA